MKAIYNLVGIILFIALWQFVSASGLINPLFLPAPVVFAHQLAKLVLDTAFLGDIGSTLLRTLFGFAIAVVIGIPLGLLMGYSSRVYDSLEFLVDFFRSIPATALIPLFVLLFGIEDNSKVFLVAFVCMLIIAFNTMYGVKHGKKLRRITGKLLGLSTWKIFTKIIFPESLPYIFVGLRLAISSAFIVIVVSEMFIGTQQGLGHRIIDAQQTYDAPTMYVAIFAAGALAYALNKFILWLEHNLTQWSNK